MDIWEDEMAMTKDVLNVDTCGYVTKISALKTNVRRTKTH
jgi:hypothetical protein